MGRFIARQNWQKPGGFRSNDRRSTQQNRPEQKHDKEEGLAIQSEPESGNEFEDTVGRFEKFCEQEHKDKFMAFCQVNDEVFQGN